MQTLQSVLKGLVCVDSLLVLELDFLKILLFYLIYKFADKECHKAIESILLIRYVVMTEYFFKAVYDFVIRSEISQFILAQRRYSDIISLTVIVKNKVVKPCFVVGFVPDLKAFFIIVGITIDKHILILFRHFYDIGIISTVNDLRFDNNVSAFQI